MMKNDVKLDLVKIEKEFTNEEKHELVHYEQCYLVITPKDSAPIRVAIKSAYKGDGRILRMFADEVTK